MPRRPFAPGLPAAAALSLLLAGCATSAGPPTVARDRFDYVSSISESWKRETLLNLVKIRYADAPVFLNVTSVINSYSVEGEVQAQAQAAAMGRGDQFFFVGGTGRYSDKPTITYAPLSGDKFARNLMTPLPIAAVLSLLQSGYRADVVLRVCVSGINGLENQYGGLGGNRDGSAAFRELLDTVRRAQALGRFDARLNPPKEKPILTLPPPAPNTEAGAVDRKFRELLKLDPQAQELAVVVGTYAENGREIAMLTRSVMQVLTDFASYIEVSDSDVAEGRVYAAKRSAEQLEMYPPLMRVRSGPAAPPDAYVAIPYRKQWFWIEDTDLPSKAMFTFLMMMFSLTETGGQQSGAPIVTVPTR